MSMRSKFLAIILVSVFGFGIFGAIAWNTLNLTKVNGGLYQKIVTKKDLIADVLPPPEYIIEAYLVTFQMMDASNAAKLDQLVARGKALRKAYEVRHAFWMKTLPDGKLKEEMTRRSYQPAMQFFAIRDKQFIPALLHGDKKKAQQILSTVLREKYEKHRAAIDEVVKLAGADLKQEESSATRIIRYRSILLGGLGILTVLLTLFLGWFFIDRSIMRQIARVVAGVNESADQVSSASIQIASASQQLAEGASEQAASLEETSSSIEEMASMTRKNADNAIQANQLMQEANLIVQGANESMTHLTSSISEISHASEETQKIIKTIDEIAFQTNLLALNAAVEAARAGEAGAGFAVVADEVRNLAMRAAAAAKDTAALIEGTVKKVKEGSVLVSETNEKFQGVAVGVNKSGELVEEITVASKEQARGIEQVNKAISQIDQVTQQNSASAEESAAASEEMSAQAAQMNGYVADLLALVQGNHNGRKQLPESLE